MSDWNFDQHNRYQRGNRGRGRFRGRRWFRRGGNSARAESFQNPSAAADEIDLASEDGIRDGCEDQRGSGRRRPRGRGRQWRRGRGTGFTTSGEQSHFADDSFDDTETHSSMHGNSTRAESRPTEPRPDSELSSSGSTAKPRTEVPAPVMSVKVDQNRILHYLINDHDGYCLVSHLRENPTLFEPSLTPNAVVQSLKQCKNLRVLINKSNLDDSVVKAFMKSLRLCFQHKPPKPCTNARCRHLHLCKDFVMDSCFVKHCVCCHDVESEQNAVIVNDCGVQIFNPKQQLSLVQCANLLVCREHNSSEGCPNQDSCFKLHICNAYVMNKCLLLDDQCSEGHDPFSERNKNVLQLHEMANLPKETIFKMLLTFRRQPQSIRKYAGNRSEAKETKPANNEPQEPHSLPMESQPEVELEEDITKVKVSCDEAPIQPPATIASRKQNLVSFTEFVVKRINPSLLSNEELKNICDAFEEHSCNLKEDCTDRHKSRTPYLWRVKLNGQWISLEKENSAIEKAFSDPSVEEFWAMESVLNEELCLNFKDMNSNLGQIQRLSTPSHVKILDKVDATRWQWYWHDGRQWILYGQSNEPPHQDILEAKYQHDPKLICCFEFGSSYYELDFAKMEQENLRTNYVREVMRRPIYEERVEWATYRSLNDVYHCDWSKLPDDWVPMNTESKDGTELIPLHSKADAYHRVAGEFFKTMDINKHKIRRIYKVQNLELWNNYTTKKASVDKYVGMETEKNVFHGTAEEGTTRWICGVGFDQRMHGVNGTVYGKGAYFATTAKYSHGYTKPSSRDLRYMYFAKITIGRVARGDSSLKRPPPIDPAFPKKGLYDSCVNDVANPSIYVIFDNSQTYPDYLIEYRDVHPDPLLDQSSLWRSRAYPPTFNLSSTNAAATHVFQPSAQIPPLPNPPPSNQPYSNPPPSKPPPSNPPPSNTFASPPPSFQNSSTTSQASKPPACLVM